MEIAEYNTLSLNNSKRQLCSLSDVPAGRPGISDVSLSLSPPPLSGISGGCHLIPLYYFLSFSSAECCYFFCLSFFLPAGPFS